MKNILMSLTLMFVAVSMSACSGNKENNSLPVTKENLKGDWKLTHIAQGNSMGVVDDSSEGEIEVISITEDEFENATYDLATYKKNSGFRLKYEISGNTIVTVGQSGEGWSVSMPDYQVISLSSTSLRIRGSEDDIDLIFTKMSSQESTKLLVESRLAAGKDAEKTIEDAQAAAKEATEKSKKAAEAAEKPKKSKKSKKKK